MEMGYWRRICRLTLLDRIKKNEIRERINICTNINNTADAKRLRWCGICAGWVMIDYKTNLLEWIPPVRRKRGRPSQTWMETIRNTMAGTEKSEV